MMAIEVESVFCAAHALRQGRRRRRCTGTTFRVTARVTCRSWTGRRRWWIFSEVEELLEQVLGPWQNQNLNMLEAFRGRVNPSAERLAEQIGLQLQGLLAGLADDPVEGRGLKVAEVRVTEAPGCVAIWGA